MKTFRASSTIAAAALSLAACAESPTAPETAGPLIALASLTSVNGQSTPCCAVTVSSGTYSRKRDALSLTPDAGLGFTAVMSGATITLWATSRLYQFVAAPAPD